MKHESVVIPNTVEIVNLESMEFSPLISKCQIKVCYVGDEPNRNHSIITKEVAIEMAPSLRGCPIVGYYNNEKEDFEEHNKIIDISNGKFEIKDTTRPYGFVDLNANVWFQKFYDDGTEHEYLMTEGYIWTGQYPEAQRIIDNGNNQSMELDENSLNAQWTKDNNGNYKFFIINEAILSKLCILGEDVEPCFEGSQITKVEFSLDDSFKETLFSLVSQMKKILNEGGTPVFNTYAVEIGDSLWESIHEHLRMQYPDPADHWCSRYRVEGIYEEGEQKFVILVDREKKLYRMNFSLTEAEGFKPEIELEQVAKEFSPVENPQFDLEDIEKYEMEYKKKKEEEEKAKEESKEESKEEPEDKGEASDKEDKSAEDKKEPAKEEAEDDKSEDEEESDKKKKKKKEDEDFACSGGDEAAKKKKKYNLEEVEEYAELTAKFEELNTQFSEISQKAAALEATVASLNETIDALKAEKDNLSQFKLSIEHKEKEEMIYKTFYMLDDEYKKDVIENIDTYSLDDIEAKLSIICVRNKIGFGASVSEPQAHNTFNLDSINDEDQAVPAWIKAVSKTAKTMKI